MDRLVTWQHTPCGHIHAGPVMCKECGSLLVWIQGGSARCPACKKVDDAPDPTVECSGCGEKNIPVKDTVLLPL